MRSDIYELDRLESDYRAIPKEAEKVAVCNGLDEKSTLRLRLLAEEMICMLPQLLIYGKGRFWIENKGKDYELHLTVEPYDMADSDREKILSVSKSGKNAAASGIIGRIIDSVEIMMEGRAKMSREDPYKYYSTGMVGYSDNMAWSLTSYRDSFDSDEKKKQDHEAWDELEKSIIANLSDDVIVGVRSGKVSIVVKKTF